MEIKPSNQMYMWANNQTNLVMAVLDKVFVSTWSDAHFPTTHVQALARIGSDHTPLVVNVDDKLSVAQRPFRFEKWWLEVRGMP
jgi:endonuclease/exonuclease/phosphatase family metal-dependent hydrolase